MTMIEAANAEEEALAIAVALREAVESDKTAALVTPDRALAAGSRCAAALEHQAEDSGGDALAETPAGIFARLAAEAALGGLAPVRCWPAQASAVAARPARHGRAVAALERAVLRGPRPRRGSAGLAACARAFVTQLEKFRSKEAADLHASDPRIAFTDGELASCRRSRFAAGRSAGAARRPRPARRTIERHGGPPPRGAGGVVVGRP